MFGAYSGLFKSLNNLESMGDTEYSLSFIDSSNKIIKQSFYDSDTGLTKSTDLRLAIVQPAHNLMMPTEQDVHIYEYVISPGILYPILKKFKGIIAVDIETNGTQAADPDTRIVGIGIASSEQICYFDFETNSIEANQLVLDFLSEYSDPIVGHNVFFDGTFLLRDTGTWLNWKFDTYALYRQLANEGYAGQTYGLKTAQVQLLNWPAKGDVQLDKWLIDNGHFSDIKKEPKKGYYRGPDVKGEARYYKPKKSMMYKAPAQILGYYCGLDAASTLMLLTEVFLPSMDNQYWEEVFLDYHDVFITNVKLLGYQQLTGITIDKEQLEAYKLILEEEILASKLTFVNHPDVREFADKLNQAAIEESLAKEPEKYKKQRIPKEPKKYKKDGSISKSYIKWEERMRVLEEEGPEISKNWINWEIKHSKILEEEQFNLNSGAQLAELFYNHLKFPVIVTTDNGDPSTGAKALPGLGELGQLLKTVKDKEKELGYVKGCLEHLIQDHEGEWRLHPQFRAPGTLTCRLAGSGGVNLQQIPKSRRYLECWRPKPGKAWVDFDFTALEQVVMAELSRDDSLYKLYGPGSKKNDVYIFNGALMARDYNVKLFQPFLDAGYDPDNPDSDIIKKIKKEHKNLRSIAKVASLGKTYGMGWEKFQMNMSLQGVKMTEDECKAVIYGLDKVYNGITEYNKYLTKELKINNGFVLNGIGRPVCCAADYVKDIGNRVVQSTGHDILMIWMTVYSQLLDEEGIPWDGIVLDFHDQSIIECDIEDVERVEKIMKIESVKVLNEILDGVINLTVDGGRIDTMADAKCE